MGGLGGGGVAQSDHSNKNKNTRELSTIPQALSYDLLQIPFSMGAFKSKGEKTAKLISITE